jgi:hypothetical protein
VVNSHRAPPAMSAEASDNQKLVLAAAIVESQPIRKWAQSNGVPERTAYNWAAEPLVRSETESIRTGKGVRNEWHEDSPNLWR